MIGTAIIGIRIGGAAIHTLIGCAIVLKHPGKMRSHVFFVLFLKDMMVIIITQLLLSLNIWKRYENQIKRGGVSTSEATDLATTWLTTKTTESLSFNELIFDQKFYFKKILLYLFKLKSDFRRDFSLNSDL
jgi:hypothetical protein